MTQLRLFELPQTEYTSDDYWTPKWIFDALAITFDLDVASPPQGPANTPCRAYFTQADDGLAQDWHGTVFMNPPFSKPAFLINSSAVLLATVEFTFVNTAISKRFCAYTLLNIISPLTIVSLAVLVLVNTVTVSFVSSEKAIEYVSISVMKSALTLCLSISPFTGVLSAIKPYLSSIPMLQLV